MNIVFENLQESSFLKGYIRMKSTIIAKWYPNLEDIELTLSKSPTGDFIVRGTLNKRTPGTLVICRGTSAVSAIDRFMDDINPHLKPVLSFRDQYRRSV